jgi:hypothetical protein
MLSARHAHLMFTVCRSACAGGPRSKTPLSERAGATHTMKPQVPGVFTSALTNRLRLMSTVATATTSAVGSPKPPSGPSRPAGGAVTKRLQQELMQLMVRRAAGAPCSHHCEEAVSEFPFPRLPAARARRIAGTAWDAVVCECSNNKHRRLVCVCVCCMRGRRGRPQMSANRSVSAFPDGDNLFQWVGTVEGSPDTVYEGLTFRLRMEFPADYPYSAPTIVFTTPCFHPNVDQFGNICLDILKVRTTCLVRFCGPHSGTRHPAPR